VGKVKQQLRNSTKSALQDRTHKSAESRAAFKAAHTAATTTTSGAPSYFSSLIPTFKRSIARTLIAHSSLLDCTATHSPFLSTTFIRTYAKSRKMPPKKAVKEEKILLGRPGNSLKSGIVGLANVGKSTLFQVSLSCCRL
jgi:ribosome biogenesis GTPase A